MIVIPDTPYLWRSPFMRVWCLENMLRVAEISTYPRVFKDTTPHVYTQDTLVDGELHYAGESLPGGFPLWIESDTLPFSPASNTQWELDFTSLPIMSDILEAEINKGGTWKSLPVQFIDRFVETLKPDYTYGWMKGKLNWAKTQQELPKILVRILYRR